MPYTVYKRFCVRVRWCASRDVRYICRNYMHKWYALRDRASGACGLRLGGGAADSMGRDRAVPIARAPGEEGTRAAATSVGQRSSMAARSVEPTILCGLAVLRGRH